MTLLTPPIFTNFHVRCDIPIYIPCFNNLTYLKNMIEQLHSLNCHNIIIVDNASTYPPLLDYLKSVENKLTVLKLPENKGPHFIVTNFYSLLPPYFCITDPDLEFNPDMPSNFVEYLIDLTEEYKTAKAGISLDIFNREDMLDDDFWINGKTYKIWEWEAQFWQHRLRENIYLANIDTTFAVYNKKFLFDSRTLTLDFFKAVRVAGPFTGKHLPWYRNNYLPTEEEYYYRQTNRHSYYFKGVIPIDLSKA